MNALETAIRDAVGAGYTPQAVFHGPEGQEVLRGDTLLDPAFWQALGKARGWAPENQPYCLSCGRIRPDRHRCFDDCHSGAGEYEWELIWVKNWHRLIDHLASGKDIESFFASL